MIKCRFIKCAFCVHSAMPWDRLPSRLQMCVAIINKAQCNWIPGFTLLNIKGGCVPKPLPFRTDFPRPDIVVNCPTDCLRKHKLSVLFMKEVNKDGLEKTNIEIMGILAFLSHYSDYLYTECKLPVLILPNTLNILHLCLSHVVLKASAINVGTLTSLAAAVVKSPKLLSVCIGS